MNYKYILLKSFFLLILLSTLTACGKQEVQTKTFSGTINSVETVIVYQYLGDKVLWQETTNLVPYSYLRLETKEEASIFFEPFADKYEDVIGVTQSIIYKEYYLVEILTVNYEKISFDDLDYVAGPTAIVKPGKGVSMKQTEKQINEVGHYQLQK